MSVTQDRASDNLSKGRIELLVTTSLKQFNANFERTMFT